MVVGSMSIDFDTDICMEPEIIKIQKRIMYTVIIKVHKPSLYNHLVDKQSAVNNLLCMKNAGTQWSMFSYLKN